MFGIRKYFKREASAGILEGVADAVAKIDALSDGDDAAVAALLRAIQAPAAPPALTDTEDAEAPARGRKGKVAA